MNAIILDGDSLTIKDTVRIARQGAKVALADAARAEIIKVRNYIEENWLTENAPPTYGFNTGVGKLKDYAINQADNDRFQLNIVLSHCSGIGEPASEEIVRAMWNEKGDLKRFQQRQAVVFRGQTAVSRRHNRGRQSCNRGTRIQRRLNRRQM